MDKFKELLLRQKAVSVWGIGYLGYTEIIRLQSKGFRTNVFDYTRAGFKERILNNEYPAKDQIYSWSERGDVGAIDNSKVNIIDDMDLMFDSNIHIFAFPVCDREGNSMLGFLADTFLRNKEKLTDSLIIFQSVGAPGLIDKDFIEPLIRGGAGCGFVSAFRSDWTIEEFLAGNKRIMLAANDEKSFAKGSFFYDSLNIRYKTLPTIKEAEIYENARNSFQYITTVFINQLALAYPDTNIRVMTEYLLEEVELNESHLSIGAGGYKMSFAIRNIIEGGRKPDFLTLVKEAQKTNLSMILTYAETVKQFGCASATLMGISIKGGLKNIEVSPSIILAEYLNKLGVRVYIDDPLYDETSLSEILPFCTGADILREGLKSEALFVMTDHSKYRYISQDDIDKLGIRNAQLIVDNVPLFGEFKFSPDTVYHAIGDGRLDIL